MENNQKQNQQGVPPLIDQTKANKDNERYFNLVVDDTVWNLNPSSLMTRCGIM